MKTIIVGILSLALCGCSQVVIENTYYVTGGSLTAPISATTSKSTKDLLDLAGSGYGEANTNGGTR